MDGDHNFDFYECHYAGLWCPAKRAFTRQRYLGLVSRLPMNDDRTHADSWSVPCWGSGWRRRRIAAYNSRLVDSQPQKKGEQ